MAVNESVYGLASEWKDINNTAWDDSIDSEYRIKAAYFGANDWNNNNLALAVASDKLSFNTPIDKSLSYCGLGDNSAYSNIKYFTLENIETANIGDELTADYTDNKDVTNFAFTLGTWNGTTYNYWMNCNTSVQGNQYRWCPSNLDVASNVARGVGFITHFSFQNFVLLIKVHCFDKPFYSGDGTPYIHECTLEEYENDVNSVRTNYPYIYAITVVPMVRYNANNDRTAFNYGATPFGIEILDAFEIGSVAPVGTPFYTYGLFQKSDYSWLIHGSLTSPNKWNTWNYNDNSTGFIAVQAFAIPDTWKVEKTYQDSTYNNIQCYREYDTDFFEETLRAVACFGCFFTPSESVAESGALNDFDMYLGILDNGIGNGEYSHGTRNEIYPQYTETGNETGYNPDAPHGNIPHSNASTFNNVSVADGGLKRYVLDDSAMSDFSDDLWNIIDTSNPDELIQNQTLTNFLTNNPLDAVVSVKRFPFSDMGGGTATNINLGKVTLPNTSGKPFTADVSIMNGGYHDILSFFGDWRDNLVKIIVTIPFCGTVELTPEIVKNKRIQINYSIDYTTGTCTAWILTSTTDGEYVVIDSANGNCCIDIPLSGVETATLTGQIYNANENLKALKFNAIVDNTQGVVNFGKSVSNGQKLNALQIGLDVGQSIVNAIHDVSTAEWNINNTQIPMKMIGASSGCNGFQLELTARITYYVPVIDSTYDESAYRATVGAQTCDACVIGDYSGYAEIANVRLAASSATVTEKAMILQLLESGVIL